jgi:hypothetical protein
MQQKKQKQRTKPQTKSHRLPDKCISFISFILGQQTNNVANEFISSTADYVCQLPVF